MYNPRAGCTTSPFLHMSMVESETNVGGGRAGCVWFYIKKELMDAESCTHIYIIVLYVHNTITILLLSPFLEVIPLLLKKHALRECSLTFLLKLFSFSL